MDWYLCENISGRKDAYALLSYAVRHRWKLDRLPAMARSEDGKPYFPAFPQYQFNLSHSGSLALCALDEDSVGTDIEVIRPHHPRLDRRICSEEELLWLNSQEDKTAALCHLWVRKEALVKQKGIGLTVPLRSIRVPLPPASRLDDLFFHSICTPEWCACACAHTPTFTLTRVSREELPLL